MPNQPIERTPPCCALQRRSSARYIAANTHPDHDTRCAFRQRFVPQSEALLVQVLSLARQIKWLLLGAVAVDGTKLHANASRHSEPMLASGRAAHHPSSQARFSAPPPLARSATPIARIKHRLLTRAGRAWCALRKQTVEPVFGIIKAVMGLRQFLLRGLHAVRGEWSMLTMAWNIRRMAALRALASG